MERKGRYSDRYMAMLGIRVDANNKIGTGHLMRCLAIAQEARQQGHDVLFICAQGDDTHVIEQVGFRLELLSIGWNQYDEECVLIGEVLRRFHVSVLLIDSYYVTANYMKCCRTYCRTAYIDDLHVEIWPCDVLINYAKYADSFDYQEEYPKTTLLLGCEYVPLREMFCHVNKVVREQASEILVLTGGTDPFHFARNLAGSALSRSGSLSSQGGMDSEDCGVHRHYTVVCGMYNDDKQQLEQMAKDNAQLDVLFNVQNMRKLMEQADIAVTAGGMTMYELAACGVPSICYSFADNQLQNTKSFADSGHMLYAGDLRQHDVVQSVLDGIDYLENNLEVRRDMLCRLQDLVDGSGAKRLVKELLK